MADEIKDHNANLTPEADPGTEPGAKPQKKHLIKTVWLRRTLKTLLGIFIFILLIPVLIYVPFIQDFAIKIASQQVEKSTGMKVGIGQFRLSFPLDVKLKDVYVVEATGDTMVKARELIADVKLLPLFKLDVDVNRLQLNDGYYRMMAPDSSMLMKIKAGFLEVDDKSSVDIKTSKIILNKTVLRNGSVSLYMDVWKKKQTPEDTAKQASAPFVIMANDLSLQDFTFGMSMLPTIDTLRLALKNVQLNDAKIDLGENVVKWNLASINGGDVTYLTPTPEYIKTHPAPPSAPSTGPPMRIMGDSIALANVNALYGVKGVKPQPGFDASYLKVNDVAIGMRNFYNESSTVRLPITKLQARERCGLQITEGHGMVRIDSIGLKLDDLNIRTPFSYIFANADVPFAMMALDPKSDMDARVEARIGLPDIEAFMPSLKSTLAFVPARKPIDLNLNASGSISDLLVNELNVSMAGVVQINASGFARNPLDIKKMVAKVNFEGNLKDPSVADKFLAPSKVEVPPFDIKGTASASGMDYNVDFRLLSPAGNVNADGHVNVTPEIYQADIDFQHLDVGRFVPTIGIGKVSGSVRAKGRGFNPLDGKAVTDAVVNISSIQYKHREFRDINLSVNLSNVGDLILRASSPNAGLDFDINGSGSIHKDDYVFDITADLRDINLQSIGLSDSICYGNGNFTIRGMAQPDKWIYDVDLDLSSFDWHLPGLDIDLPTGITASVNTNPIHTDLSLETMLTSLDFESETGLQNLISSFSHVGSLLTAQLKDKSIQIEELSNAMPDFHLGLNASGRGMLSQLLGPSGLAIDTVYASFDKDSIFNGNINVTNFMTGSLTLDTLTLDLSQRGELLDYRLHLGNQPGTLDEFHKVNLNGYVGENRISAYLNQWNIKNEQGYKIGLTAALMDSVVTVHITPLKSVIAYLPWTFNSDNFVDFNMLTKHIEANLQAKSNESSIMAKTQIGRSGKEELNVRIDNLHIQDFLSMWAGAPPIKGDLNTNLHILYDNNRFKGGGTIGFHDFVYDRIPVGDFDLGLGASYGLDQSTDLRASLKINGEGAISAFANLRPDSSGELKADSIGLSLTRFPLKIANAFLGNSIALGGYLNGNMRMDGKFSAPRLNGALEFDSAMININMLGVALKLNDDRVSVADNVISFKDFSIFGANKNPLIIDGSVDATKFSDISVKLNANANNFALVDGDNKSKGDLYGKVFLNLDGSAVGPLRRLDVNANATLLGTTDAIYRLNMEPADFKASSDEGIVKFVNFNDTTQIAKVDTVATSAFNMRLNAGVIIAPGTQLEVLLSSNGTDKVVLNPSANLSLYQNYMGDMTMNGTLTLGEGYVRYAIPVIGEKMFEFNPTSTVSWNGPIANPTLNVTASDEVKATVTSDGNSHLANFFVTVHVTNPVDNIKVNFDLSTNDDLSLQNELSSMSADQRQTQAMNLLLYGQYMGQNTKATAAGGNMLYSFLESQLNSWAAKNIKGVDLSFGVNQYDKTTNGMTNTETSYSYQVSKSLFNNRFKILVGGNYSTDTDDSDIAENLISDVSVEYILRQSQTMDMSVRLFRHIGYESVLEGEVTEMGAGFVMKRRLENLKSLFNWRRKKKKTTPEKTDSVEAVTPLEESSKQ